MPRHLLPDVGLAGALQAIPTTRIETLKHQGTRSSKALAEILERRDETMVALLALDAAANAGVVICGVTVASRAAATIGLDGQPIAAVILACLLLFGLFLFFDLLPRTLGVAFGDTAAIRSAIAIRSVVRALAPIVIMGRAVSRLVPKPKEGGRRPPRISSPSPLRAPAPATSSRARRGGSRTSSSSPMPLFAKS